MIATARVVSLLLTLATLTLPRAAPAQNARSPSVLMFGDLLDAAESQRLTLSARLVVLSACEPGTGAARPTEDVLGLQRTFLALGAETLLVSLWRVDDAATRALMGAFYQH